MPWPARCSGPVDLFGRAFLEAGEPEIADPFGGAHSLHPMTLSTSTWRRTSWMASGRAVAALRLDLDGGSFGSLSRLAASSRLSPLIERPSIADDQLTGLDASFPALGPPRMTPTRCRPSLSILSSTPRSTKLPSIMA